MDESDLPELTEKQYKFVLGIKSGLSKADAYRQAYDCAGSAKTTVWANAARLARDTKIAPWLLQIKSEQISAATYTLEEHLARMEDLTNKCEAAGAWSSAIKGRESMGKACNHYTSNIEVTHTRTADTDLLSQLEKLLGPDAANQAAVRLGYKPKDTEHNGELH